jgi:hypothetical protein
MRLPPACALFTPPAPPVNISIRLPARSLHGILPQCPSIIRLKAGWRGIIVKFISEDNI